MINQGREILVLLNTETITEQEVEQLDLLLKQVETPESFCTAHELVDRNRISSSHKKILRESNHFRLRAFRFLINKN